MKRVGQLLILALFVSAIVGCQSGGDISVSDVQKNAKAQADWIKQHPPAPDTHIEH